MGFVATRRRRDRSRIGSTESHVQDRENRDWPLDCTVSELTDAGSLSDLTSDNRKMSRAEAKRRIRSKSSMGSLSISDRGSEADMDSAERGVLCARNTNTGVGLAGNNPLAAGSRS